MSDLERSIKIEELVDKLGEEIASIAKDDAEFVDYLVEAAMTLIDRANELEDNDPEDRPNSPWDRPPTNEDWDDEDSLLGSPFDDDDYDDDEDADDHGP